MLDYFLYHVFHISDVPETHIFNFDETNFSDDPKNKKVEIC